MNSKSIFIVVAALVVGISCDRQDPVSGIDGTSSAALTISFRDPFPPANGHLALGPTGITSVHLSVSGPGIENDINATLQVTNNGASGTVSVPKGNDRVFDIEALDANNIVWYWGMAEGVDLTEDVETVDILADLDLYSVGNNQGNFTTGWSAGMAGRVLAEQINVPGGEALLWGVSYYINSQDGRTDTYESVVFNQARGQIAGGNPILNTDDWTWLPINWPDISRAIVRNNVMIGLRYLTSEGTPVLGYEVSAKQLAWVYDPPPGPGWRLFADAFTSTTRGSFGIEGLFLLKADAAPRKSPGSSRVAPARFDINGIQSIQGR